MVGRLAGTATGGGSRLDRLELRDALTVMEWLGDLVPRQTVEAGLLRGLRLLEGPEEELLALVRQHARDRRGLPVGRATSSGLQPMLPGLDAELAEPVAALVREAARH